MSEIWKDVPGYEGFYQVSNYGNVMAKDRITFDGRRLKKHICKQYHDEDGYKKVTFCKNGKAKQYFVHRLVAICFVDNPSCFSQINHKDECKENNHFTNLEWCDVKYNINYGKRTTKAISKITGEKSKNSKLTESQVRDIKLAYKRRSKNSNTKTLSILYGVSSSEIRRIVNGIRWKHVNKEF